MRTLTILLSLTCLLFGQDYIVDQVANGSPGTGRSDAGELLDQRVWITADKFKIAETGGELTASIVRLDTGKLYLLYPEHKLYKVRDIATLTAKSERAAKRASLLAKILAMPIDASEQDALLAENGLRRDGSVEARVVATGRRRDIAGFATQEKELYENDIRIATLWLADLPRPDGLFGAYTAINSFSDEVEAALAAIDTFPLAMEIRLDTGDALAFTLEAEANGIVPGATIPDEVFDVPADYAEIAWDAPLPADEHTCFVCGGPVPAGERHWEDRPDVYLCGGRCKIQYIKQRKAEGD